MKHVVVYGPAACGKTRNKGALARAFGCRNIMDEVQERELLKPVHRTIKTLFLTIERPRRLDPKHFEILPFAEAMREAGLAS